MKPVAKVTLCACFIALTLFSVAAFRMTTRDYNKDDTTHKAQSDKLPLAEKSKKTESVSLPVSETEKYILKYAENENAVYLITKKTDGTEIISPVESINPFYLTDEDLSLLKEGIELTKREDMYILIEDYSS